jgi:hypothetical protein
MSGVRKLKKKENRLGYGLRGYILHKINTHIFNLIHEHTFDLQHIAHKCILISRNLIIRE